MAGNSRGVVHMVKCREWFGGGCGLLGRLSWEMPHSEQMLMPAFQNNKIGIRSAKGFHYWCIASDFINVAVCMPFDPYSCLVALCSPLIGINLPIDEKTKKSEDMVARVLIYGVGVIVAKTGLCLCRH